MKHKFKVGEEVLLSEATASDIKADLIGDVSDGVITWAQANRVEAAIDDNKPFIISSIKDYGYVVALKGCKWFSGEMDESDLKRMKQPRP